QASNRASLFTGKRLSYLAHDSPWLGSSSAARSQSITSRATTCRVTPGFDHVSCGRDAQPARTSATTATLSGYRMARSVPPPSGEGDAAASDRVRLDVLVGAVDVGQRVAPLHETGHVDEPPPDPVGDARHVLARVGRAVVGAGQRLLAAREHDGLDGRRVPH